jgi:hypothetical protein
VDEKLKKDISNIKVRTAKKYVYFDAKTGVVKFEYGGVTDKRLTKSTLVTEKNSDGKV